MKEKNWVMKVRNVDVETYKRIIYTQSQSWSIGAYVVANNIWPTARRFSRIESCTHIHADYYNFCSFRCAFSIEIASITMWFTIVWAKNWCVCIQLNVLMLEAYMCCAISWFSYEYKNTYELNLLTAVSHWVFVFFCCSVSYLCISWSEIAKVWKRWNVRTRNDDINDRFCYLYAWFEYIYVV